MQINTGIVFTLARKHALAILNLLQITKKSLCLNFGMIQSILLERAGKIIQGRKTVICSCPLKEMSHEEVAYSYQN